MLRRAGRVAALIVGLSTATVGSVGNAQGWYFINGVAANTETAAQLAAVGLPFGFYWLQNNGDWGVVGDPVPRGNLFARSASPPHRGLSERGLLYSPGELLR